MQAGAGAPVQAATTAATSAALRLARVLRAENDALTAGDAEAAMALLPEKVAAVDHLRAAMPGIGAPVSLALAAELRDLAALNAQRLAEAIDIQGRILEMVARAARAAAPSPAFYARPRHGPPACASEPLALAVRA